MIYCAAADCTVQSSRIEFGDHFTFAIIAEQQRNSRSKPLNFAS